MCAQVRADSALRGIGRAVSGVPGRGRAGAAQKPVARAFSQPGRRGGDGLLSGHVSSTEAAGDAEKGTPPRTAAEALAAMQSRLAADSSQPPTANFSSPKALDTQVPSRFLSER